MATATLEKVEFSVEIEVVGCRHYNWDQARFDADFDITERLRFRPEPLNPHDPKAVMVMYAGLQCGYVSKQNHPDIQWLQKALNIISPYLKQIDFNIDTEQINSVDGVIHNMTLDVRAEANVPKAVAQELEELD